MRKLGQFLRAGKIPNRAPGIDQVCGRPEGVHVVHAQVVTAPLQHVLALLQGVPVMAGLAQRGGEPFARVQPADVLSATRSVERGNDPPRDVERILVAAEAAQVACYRVRGGESVHVIGTQNPPAIFKGALVGLEGLLELAEQSVIDRDAVPDIQRALIMTAESRLKFVNDGAVQVECRAELAMAAKDRAVEILAEQEHSEPVTVVVALQQRPGAHDQLVSVGRAAADVHGDRDLNGQGQDLRVVLAETLPPYLKGVKSELHRLYVPAAQVQSSDLADDECAQCRVLRAQESRVGLEVLQGEVIDRVIGQLIGVTWVRVRQQRVGGRAVRVKRLDPVEPEPPLGYGLDHPVDLDHVSGAFDPGQGQPVQLGGGGPEPRRRGEQFGQSGRIVDARRGPKEKLVSDRFW
jgi:hypothetical protein